ncbi:MAG: glutamine amidotransferase, partial [Terriglobia bacterium]
MVESIFQFLFKYPAVAYSRGQLTLASGWPAWVLVAAIVAGAALVGAYLWRLKPQPTLPHGALVWALQSLTLAVLLLLLWRPSLI